MNYLKNILRSGVSLLLEFNPLMERELVDMFMGTLQGPYYDRMVGSTSTSFFELVMAGERIEAGPKMGKF